MWRGCADIENARVVVPLRAMDAQKKQGDRSRPAVHHASGGGVSRMWMWMGESMERVIGRSYGSNTLSITWMTPLLWYTFAIVTLAVLPFASVTVTSLPAVLKVSVPPCTVA
jgi:hypothetical protein